MSPTTTIELPRDILDSARLSAADIRRELAVALYAQGRLSVGKARELAGMALWRFRLLLASRDIAPHLSIADVDQEADALRDRGLV